MYWTSWGTWGNCSVSCGQGKQSRKRQCKNSNPLSNGCGGQTLMFKTCIRRPC